MGAEWLAFFAVLFAGILHFQRGNATVFRFEEKGLRVDCERGPGDGGPDVLLLENVSTDGGRIYLDRSGHIEALHTASLEQTRSTLWAVLDGPSGEAVTRGVYRSRVERFPRRFDRGFVRLLPLLLVALLVVHLAVFARRPSRAVEPEHLSPARFAARCLAVAAIVATVQLILQSGFAGGSAWTWAAFWIYTFLGVVLPGSLLASRTINRRTDWLTWLGLGWALGHACELVSLLFFRALGAPHLFLAWIPLAYAIAWWRRSSTPWNVRQLRRPVGAVLALVLLALVGGTTHFVLGLPEISPSPPSISDIWFHVSNAIEFRDHAPMQDPRLAGETFNYHVFGYAAAAGASLATGESLAPIFLRHSVPAFVFLAALGIFNAARAVTGRLAAGVVAALIWIFPLDLFALFGERFGFGSSLQFYGIYLSPTTLAGHVYLGAALLVVSWFLRGASMRSAWVLPLLVFAGSGSKAMLGPVLVGAAVALALWSSAARSEARRAWTLAGAVALGALPALLPLLLGEGSYSQTVLWSFAGTAEGMPFFAELTRLGWPATLAKALWLPGFSALVLIGALAALRKGAVAERGFAVFVWGLFAAAAVPGLFTRLSGDSQLFFLYYGLAALTVLAGAGWSSVPRSWTATAFHLGLAAWVLAGVQAGGRAAPLLASGEGRKIWARASWWQDVADPDRRIPSDRLVQQRLGYYYAKKLRLGEDQRAGIAWARANLPANAVFAMNALEASPYAALAEARAFLETTRYHVSSHLQHAEILRGDTPPETQLFADRVDVLRAWQRGLPDVADRLRAAGVTHLFVDRTNGYDVRPVPGAVSEFSSPTFEILSLQVNRE